jgi:hypothetical protein
VEEVTLLAHPKRERYPLQPSGFGEGGDSGLGGEEPFLAFALMEFHELPDIESCADPLCSPRVLRSPEADAGEATGADRLLGQDI